MMIGLGALAWAMRGLDWRLILQSLTSAHYTWVLVSLLLTIGVALTKAARWGALYVVSDRHLAFRDLFSVLIIAQMLNVLIPIRVGELARIGLMKQSGEPGASTVATIVIEKGLDLLAVGLMAVSLVALSVAPAWMQQWSFSALLIGLTLVSGLFMAWYLREWMERILARLLALGGWLPEVWRRRLLRVADTLFQALGALTHWSSLLRVSFWMVVVWLLSVLAIGALFSAFDLNLPPAVVIIMVLAVGFSNVIPSPPGLVGVMHAIAVVVLGEYGISQPVALAFGIIMNIVSIAPLVVLGGLALWQRTLTFGPVLREQSWRRLLGKFAKESS